MRLRSVLAWVPLVTLASCSGDDTASALECGAGTTEVAGRCVLAESGIGGSGYTGGAGGAGGTSAAAGADASSGGMAGISGAGSSGTGSSSGTAGIAGQGVDGGSDAGDASTGCPPWFTDAGTSVGATSCITGEPGTGSDCGYQAGDDCCASIATPCGTFNRSNDVLYPATISSFRLDKYEVTVGRFRKFVAAGGGVVGNPPSPGAGAHPTNPATGWDSSWNQSLALDTPDLIAKLKCGELFEPPNATWTDVAGANETKPINCVSWYSAFAFCAWDGGRLPTEAEWNYAAAGGKQQQYYPFSWDKGQTVTDDNCTCSASGPTPVGSPQWALGFYKHWDQGGNVEEWTFDRNGPYPVPCIDCACLVEGPYPGRSVRGGHFHSCSGQKNQVNVSTEKRFVFPEAKRRVELGFRCARAL